MKRTLTFVSALILSAVFTTGAVAQSAGPSAKRAMVQTKASQSALTPEKAIAKLKEGNRRFMSGKIVNQLSYRKQVAATAKGQYPFAAIVSCLDSRVSVDDIFDLNNGDAFNARVAGNVVDEAILGSLEFGTKVVGAKTIVVLGHTNCGAIKGACDDVKLGNLTGLLDKIRPSVEQVSTSWIVGEKNSKNHEFVEAVGEANVKNVMNTITKDSPIIRELVDSGQVAIVGAVYDLETGEVRFLER